MPDLTPPNFALEAGRGQHRNGRIRRAFQDGLVLEYLDLAESLAGRYASRGRDRADLNQVAYLGLIKAARGFDAGKGGSFPAYAAPTITGELKRYLRDRCWMVRPPRHIQDLRSRILREEPALAQNLGRAPSEAELAQELDVAVEDVREALNAATSMRPDSLDAPDLHSDTPPRADTLVAQESAPERLEELVSLSQAIRELCPDERELLYRRYYCEETQVELGKRFGMSQMQVSRQLSKILVRLQQRLLERTDQFSPSSRTASSTS